MKTMNKCLLALFSIVLVAATMFLILLFPFAFLKWPSRSTSVGVFSYNNFAGAKFPIPGDVAYRHDAHMPIA